MRAATQQCGRNTIAFGDVITYYSDIYRVVTNTHGYPTQLYHIIGNTANESPSAIHFPLTGVISYHTGTPYNVNESFAIVNKANEAAYPYPEIAADSWEVNVSP